MRFIVFALMIFNSSLLLAQDQMFDICPIKVGAEIPEATLMDDESQAIALSKLIADQPTVLIFYRGAWCGYCTKHLAELNDIKKDITDMGYQVVGITVDQASKIEESYKKSASEIQVYSDAKLEAISAFGLDWKVDDEMFDKYKNKYKLDLEEWSGEDHHSLPVPAIFIIKDGLVQFQYVNPKYSVRLKPETLLAVLKTI